MTTQPENKDKAEQKVSKDELSEKELEKAAGGSVSLSFSEIKVEYKPQNADGTSK
jgi:type VI protein secretion system component Hcp